MRAHASEPPTEIVDRIMMYAAPNVETLRRAFDAYLADFMEISAVAKMAEQLLKNTQIDCAQKARRRSLIMAALPNA